MGCEIYGGGGKPEEEKTVTAGTSVMEVSPSSGKTIKKIEITVDGTYYGNSLTVDSGTITPTRTSGGTIVWEGNASSVTITNVASASNVQIRPTSIKITYAE